MLETAHKKTHGARRRDFVRGILDGWMSSVLLVDLLD